MPEHERGKYKIGSFIDVTCMPQNDCAGSAGDWEKVSTYQNAGPTGTRYDVISWKRAECGYKPQ